MAKNIQPPAEQLYSPTQRPQANVFRELNNCSTAGFDSLRHLMTNRTFTMSIKINYSIILSISLVSFSYAASEPDLKHILLDNFCKCEDPYNDYSANFHNNDILNGNDSIIPILLSFYSLSNQQGLTFDEYIMDHKCHSFDKLKYASVGMKAEMSFSLEYYARKMITSFGETATPYILNHIIKDRGDDDDLLSMLESTATEKYKVFISEKLLKKYIADVSYLRKVVHILSLLGDNTSVVPLINSILKDTNVIYQKRTDYVDILADIKSTSSLPILVDMLCELCDQNEFFEKDHKNMVWEPVVTLPTALWKITGIDDGFSDLYDTGGKMLKPILYKEINGNNRNCRRICKKWNEIINKSY